jgi:DNA-binding NarL/FixJ family response regulator
MTALTVALVDNNCFVTDKVHDMLRTRPEDFTVVCLAETVDEMMTGTDGGRGVDVVLLDVFLADGSTPIDNVDRILTAGLRLLVTSSEPHHPDVLALLRARPVSFLSTKDLFHELHDALRRTAHGDTIMKQDTAVRVRAGEPSPPPGLTPREEDVFRLWATLMPVKRVANRLGIREDTARDHITNIREKFRRIGRPIDDDAARHYLAIEYGYIASPRHDRSG